MTYDAIAHLRMTQAQLNYLERQSKKYGVNKSTVVRQLIDKAIKKDGKSKTK